MEITVRKAERRDLEDLLEIYNYEVLYGISNLDLHAKTMEDWILWYEAHNVDNHPLYVAEMDGKAVGYAALSSYREKEAYCSSVELSIYVHLDYRRRGVATELLRVILDDARSDARTHLVVSVITSGNEASRKLHEMYGFRYCGTVHEVGMKFGEYRDIDNYELLI